MYNCKPGSAKRGLLLRKNTSHGPAWVQYEATEKCDSLARLCQGSRLLGRHCTQILDLRPQDVQTRLFLWTEARWCPRVSFRQKERNN